MPLPNVRTTIVLLCRSDIRFRHYFFWSTDI